MSTFVGFGHVSEVFFVVGMIIYAAEHETSCQILKVHSLSFSRLVVIIIAQTVEAYKLIFQLYSRRFCVFPSRFYPQMYLS